MFLEMSANFQTASVLHHSVTCSTKVLAQAIATALGATWEVDRIDSDDGASLLLTPVAHPRTDTAFLLEAIGQRLALSILQNDRLEFHGSYGSVNAMVAACATRWATCRADGLLFQGMTSRHP